MLKRCIVAFAVLVGVCSPGAASELVSPSALVKQWAQGINKPVLWEAGNLYERLTIEVKQNVHVSSEADLDNALSGLNQIIESTAAPLKACIFSDTIVIRRIDQPECGQRLQADK